METPTGVAEAVRTPAGIFVTDDRQAKLTTSLYLSKRR